MEETYMSINRGTDKKDVVTYITHTHNGILVIKINEILSFAATWLDLEIIILGKVKKKKFISFTCLFTKQKETHRLRKQPYYQRGKGRGRNKLGVWC